MDSSSTESEIQKETNKDSYNDPSGQLTTFMERLPREALFEILSRLPITSLLQCKLVSRRWYTSVKAPLLASMHLSRFSEDNLCFILFSDWPRSKLHLVQLDSFDGHQAESIKSLNTPFETVLPEFDLVGSCNGLLCLYKYGYDDPLYIYNPFTREYNQLPSQNLDNSKVCAVAFGFGFHPRTKDYKAIKIVYYRKKDSYLIIEGDPDAFVLTFGTDSSWRNIGKLPHKVIGPASEALVCGNLHWLTPCLDPEAIKNPNIIAFDLETEEFCVFPGPELEPKKSDRHLVTLRGCLSLVASYRGDTSEIWVMKDYNVKDSWSKQFVIRNYVPRGVHLFMGMPPARIRKNGYMGRVFRVLCQLQNGEIVYLHDSKCLVSFDPVREEFKDLEFQGLALEFQTLVHMGSFVSVEAACGNPM